MAKKLPRRPGSAKALPPPPKKGPKRPGKPSGAAPPTKGARGARPARPRRVRRSGGGSGSLFKKLFYLVVLIALIVGGVGGYLFYRGQKSLPVTDGAVTVRGLTSSVEVVRDANGIPHISGADVLDVARATGYVHAQDRLFQMELGRRLGAGRLAEIFGAEAVAQDRVSRQLGLVQAAQSELDRMSSEGREILEAYAVGVNAYREQNLEQLPPEFQLLGHVPEPWRALDSVTIGKWFAYVLSSNGTAEVLRGQLVDAVGVQAAYVLTGLTPPPPTDESSRAPTSFRLASALSRPERFHAGASNAWVVASERSASQRPLLAADPHLSLPIPSIFYEIQLSGGGLDVAGASIPGLPLVVFGQNQRIAWGITALFADVQDVYIESVNPANPRQYAWDGQWVDLDVVTESIPVKDGAAVSEEVRVTRHGVVVGEADDGRLLAQRWDAVWNGDHVTALVRLNRAASWQEFTEALRSWSSPALSFVYADVEGNIGFFPVGDIPVRVSFDGAVPVDGSSGEFEWEGNIPHDLKPMIFNPENGVIVSANHRMFPADTPYPLGVDTLADFRARRINDLVQASSSLTLDDFARIQRDRYDVATEPILRHIVQLRPDADEPMQAIQILRDWNGRMEPGPAPAIYYAIYVELLHNTFRDELGDDIFDHYLEFLELGHPGGVHAIVDDETSPFWDDKATPEVEDRTQIFARSLEGGLARLSAELGGNVSQWDWARVHGVHFRHPLGREEPLSWLFSRGPIPFGGSTNTVANAVVSLREPFDTTIGTSFRFLADLSDLSRSRTSVPTGASGHPLSPHYFDQNPRWISGESHTLLDGSSSGRLLLQP